MVFKIRNVKKEKVWFNIATNIKTTKRFLHFLVVLYSMEEGDSNDLVSHRQKMQKYKNISERKAFMKHLSMFTAFDFDRFAAGKEFLVVESAPWMERDSNKVLGTVVTVVIFADNSDYGEGKTGNNRFEKLKLKVKKQVSVSPDTRVVPINAIAKVYGDYNNQLSVTCDDIRIIDQKGQKQ